jgi:isopenicillin N synthase-like dioxygenase
MGSLHLDANTDDAFAPPPGPPPLLSDDQIVSLATQGHLLLPLSPELTAAYEDLFRVASDFFSQPDATKSALYPNPGSVELGYTHVLGEKEYLTLRSVSHPDSDLEKLVARVWHDTGALLQRVMVDLARGLGLPGPRQIWDPLLDGCLDLPPSEREATPTILRMFQYAPDSGFAEKHTDTGLLTLCVTRGSGLQVLTQEAARWVWKDVQGPTLLIGTALQILVGHRVRAGLHQVVANPQGRRSAIFALRPSLRHRCDLGIFGGDVRVGVEELWEGIRGSRYNINAPKEMRDLQKQDLMKKSKSSQTDGIGL